MNIELGKNEWIKRHQFVKTKNNYDDRKQNTEADTDLFT